METRDVTTARPPLGQHAVGSRRNDDYSSNDNNSATNMIMTITTKRGYLCKSDLPLGGVGSDIYQNRGGIFLLSPFAELLST